VLLRRSQGDCLVTPNPCVPCIRTCGNVSLVAVCLAVPVAIRWLTNNEVASAIVPCSGALRLKYA